MACKFLRFSVCIDVETGECIDLVKSTSELTVGEMSDYIEQVISWALHQFNPRRVDADGNPVIVRGENDFYIPAAGEQISFV